MITEDKGVTWAFSGVLTSVSAIRKGYLGFRTAKGGYSRSSKVSLFMRNISYHLLLCSGCFVLSHPSMLLNSKPKTPTMCTLRYHVQSQMLRLSIHLIQSGLFIEIQAMPRL